MKKLLALLSACAILALGYNANATIYGDSIGENFTGAGGGILDIASVEVTHNALDLMFKINLTGDPSAADWGKYMIAIDSAPGGDSAGNGWGRPISMAGMDYWLGSWVDSGNGLQVHAYSGSWSQIGAVGMFAGGPPVVGLAITKDASSVTITTPRSLLGLGGSGSFNFDVYTSGGGGGDSAVDALANPLQSINDWGVPYATQSPNVYTIPEVPEPAFAALIGLGGLMIVQRSFRRR